MIDENFFINIDNVGKIPVNEIARGFLERFNFDSAEPNLVERVGRFDIENIEPRIGDIVFLSDNRKALFNSVTELSVDNWHGNYFIRGAMWRNNKWEPVAGYMYMQNGRFSLFGNSILYTYHTKPQFWEELLCVIELEEEKTKKKKAAEKLKLTKALKFTNFGVI